MKLRVSIGRDGQTLFEAPFEADAESLDENLAEAVAPFREAHPDVALSGGEVSVTLFKDTEA